MKTHHWQLARFIAVGTVSAAVHLAVVTLLVRLVGWAPLLANLAGWMVAFWVSFMGHYGWTFRETSLEKGVSARRFALLSADGFLLNESAYAVALHGSNQRFDVLLALVLVGTAVATFFSSKLWAFRGGPHAP